MGGQHVHRTGQGLQSADLHHVMLTVVAPVLDGADGGDFLEHAQQGVQGVVVAAAQHVLEGDHRQIGGIGDGLEMSQCHFRAHLPTAAPDAVWREHQQSRRTGFIGHARDACRLQAAVGIDTVDDQHIFADLVHGQVQHPALFVEIAGVDLRRMAVEGDGRNAPHRSGVAQMRARRRLVDGKSSLKDSNVAGITPRGSKFLNRVIESPFTVRTKLDADHSPGLEFSQTGLEYHNICGCIQSANPRQAPVDSCHRGT